MNRIPLMQPTSQRATWCQVLGVTPQATESEIRQAYLNLVNVWHPDRFAPPHLKAMAEEKLKEIINAYESLEAARGSEAIDSADQNPSSAATHKSAVPATRISSKWMPLAATLATVLVLGAIFYATARSPSRVPARQLPAASVENIPSREAGPITL